MIWYRASTRYLFVKDGVYKGPKEFKSTELKAMIWTLVDSDELATVPPELAVQQTKHLIIFTTSLQPSRWKPLRGTTIPGVILMNPWTSEELLNASVPPFPSLIKLIIFHVVLGFITLRTRTSVQLPSGINSGRYPEFVLTMLKALSA